MAYVAANSMSGYNAAGGNVRWPRRTTEDTKKEEGIESKIQACPDDSQGEGWRVVEMKHGSCVNKEILRKRREAVS